MARLLPTLLATASLLGAALAQTAPPSPAANRFPQPVRVGDLIGRDLLAPTEAQHVLGRVAAIARRPGGDVEVIVRVGGVFGIGAHRVAVPVEAVALLGEYVALLGLTPAQLDALPAAPASATPLAPGETIKVGLVKPFH